jgi:hypothetical protein
MSYKFKYSDFSERFWMIWAIYIKFLHSNLSFGTMEYI